MRWTGQNAVLLLLAAGIAGVAGLGFVGAAPNRILSAQSLSLWSSVRPGYLAAFAIGLGLYLAGAVVRQRRVAGPLVFAGAAVLFLTAFAAAGDTAGSIVATGAPSARVSLGGAFWTIVLVSAMAMTEALTRLGIGLGARLLVALAVVAILATMAMQGAFDDLSIAREFMSHRDAYGTALVEHVELVLIALVLALAIGVPLGVLATRKRRLAPRIFAILGLIQTIPSIALFGLLIGPLTALSEAVPGLREIGLRGIGFTPALIALVLYGLLPIARNTEVGLLGVPASVVDAARGMGMTAQQRMMRVSIPLALPVLLAGLRIVTVQTIGMAVVAALIGAGGFGQFVFAGLGQTATDLVLLGAISSIVLALAADSGLRLFTLAVTRNVPR